MKKIENIDSFDDLGKVRSAMHMRSALVVIDLKKHHHHQPPGQKRFEALFTFEKKLVFF